MTAQTLLETLSTRGVVLEAEAGRIHWRGKITNGDKANIQAHKPELLSLLLRSQQLPKEIKPYISVQGDLVIPSKSHPRYHHWRGGQPIVTTLAELNAPPEIWRKHAYEEASLLVTHHQRCNGVLIAAAHEVTFCPECYRFTVTNEPMPNTCCA